MDLREYWVFSDPAGSEARFRQLLDGPLDDGLRLEIQTQISRTYSLRKQFEEAHRVLDAVEADHALERHPRARAFALLERGRSFNSAGLKEKARVCFEEAAQTDVPDAQIDALHMLAIIADPHESEQLNRKAIGLARESIDPRAQRWLAGLLNNLGWTFHEAERYAEALECFSEALVERIAQGQDETTRIAQWCVARCLRSMGRLDEALAIQMELNQGPVDGYVQEEMGELLFEKGLREEAKPFYGRALALLVDEGLSQDRLERMRFRSE
jgi:tetratricopeptide (TPR) repeat protein